MATFTNKATLSYNNLVTNSNVTTGQLLEVLSVTKTAVRHDYIAGDSMTYIISIINSGAIDFTGLTVTDSLGAYPFGADQLYPLDYVVGSLQFYVNGALQTVPAVAATAPLTITGVRVPHAGNATLIYEAKVNRYAPLGVNASIQNTVQVSEGGLASPIQDDEIILTRDVPDLSISKSISPTTVTENDRLTYTFIIQNAGNTGAVAADDIVISDIFTPALSNIVVSFNGTPWTDPTYYSYVEATGVFSTVAGRITVPAATYTQDTAAGHWIIDPGFSVLTVTGTI